MIAAGGVCAETAYPYLGAAGACAAARCTKVATVKSYGFVAANSQAAMQTAVRQQPITVAVAAGSSSWQLYASGVMNACGSTGLDHAVLLTGFDSDAAAGDFWRLKCVSVGRAQARVVCAARVTRIPPHSPVRQTGTSGARRGARPVSSASAAGRARASRACAGSCRRRRIPSCERVSAAPC